jgi:transcriptional regulator with XRE-family HTH domain
MTIIEYLKEKSMSQREFADVCGITQSTLSNYIHGKKIPRPKMARLIEQMTDGMVKAKDLLVAKKPRISLYENLSNENQK